MSELPEIHNFARTIQEQAAHRTFNRIVQPRIAKWPRIDSRGGFEAQAPFTLSAVARGKELQLTMVLPNGLSVDFNHGLEGRWVWHADASSVPSGSAMLEFHSTDGGCLRLVDNMASWHRGRFEVEGQGGSSFNNSNSEGLAQGFSFGLTPRVSMSVMPATTKTAPLLRAALVGDSGGVYSTTSKLLLLMSILFKEGKIEAADKDWLKEIVVAGGGRQGGEGKAVQWLKKLEACLEYFEAENDLDEVGETMRILTRCYVLASAHNDGVQYPLGRGLETAGSRQLAQMGSLLQVDQQSYINPNQFNQLAQTGLLLQAVQQYALLSRAEDPVSCLDVNPKQYHRILKRRQERTKLEAKYQIMPRREWLYDSRHQHTKNRQRGPGGRFLSKVECDKLRGTTIKPHHAPLPTPSSSSSHEPSYLSIRHRLDRFFGQNQT